jgi:glycosyltransferase involved in cell wall biosynthesis
VKEAVRIVAQALLAPVVLPVLVGAALRARRDTLRRRGEGTRPRLLYGPSPIISIKYMREAMAAAGYEARTVVYGSFPIFASDNYDHTLAEFMPSAAATNAWKRAPAAILGPFVVFLWALPRFDVFHFFFDGGLLRTTPFRFLEIQLLHLAGKKVIAFPYGSDVAVPSGMRSQAWREALVETYPRLARRERQTRRQIRYFCSRADFVVACVVHEETLTRWDLLATHYYPIDTDAWRPPEPPARRDRPLTIFHAPNHPLIKGTDHLVEACRRLREDGVEVELRLVQGIPNEELKQLLAESDVLAEQFLLGYGIAAMEGMSLGKPVLSNLSDERYYSVFRQHTGLDECPILSTTPEELEKTLRVLAADPAGREERGSAGREYVLKHHSYETVARMWDLVYRKLWDGEDIDLIYWHPDHARARPAAAVG